MASWHFGEVTGNLLFNDQPIQQHQDSKVKINAFFTLDSIFFLFRSLCPHFFWYSESGIRDHSPHIVPHLGPDSHL